MKEADKNTLRKVGMTLVAFALIALFFYIAPDGSWMQTVLAVIMGMGVIGGSYYFLFKKK